MKGTTEQSKLYADDYALIAGLRAGEDAAFTRVYQQLYQRVFWFARKFVDSEADAQDMTADTFVQLWHHRGDFSYMNEISGFLHTTVRNKCFNLLKRSRMMADKRAELLHLLEEQDVDEFYLEQVRIDLMRKIFVEVDKLPTRMREIFLLSYQEGLKPAQIAERLELKVQTVTNQRVTAIRLLQAALSGNPLVVSFLFLLESEHLFIS